MSNMHLVTGYAGKPHVTAADHAALLAALFGTSNFVLDTAERFAATVLSNNLIEIAAGDLLLQGRHARLNGGTVSLTIETGTVDMLRSDLIVARYERNSTDGVESVNLAVIKGTAAAQTPEDPAIVSGDILSGQDLIADMPLYRVVINGLSIEAVQPLFTVLYALPAAVAENTASAAAAQNAADSASALAAKAAALGLSLYRAAVLCDGFAAGVSGYSQRVTPQVLTGAAVTAATQLAPPMLLPTGEQATDEALAETLALINAGFAETAAGSITLTVWELPATDIELYWYGR